MATTTNYSWSTPDDTALVKDGAAAIRSLGTAIDSTVFTNAGAAINKSIVDAAGDLIYGTADNTVARLALGTANQVLKVNSGATAPEWGTAPAGGMTLISTTTLSGASVALTSIPADYINLQLIVRGFRPASDGEKLELRFNNDSTANRYANPTNDDVFAGTANFNVTSISIANGTDNATSESLIVTDIHDYKNTTTWKSIKAHGLTVAPNGTSYNYRGLGGFYNQTGAITEINLLPSSGNFTSGTALLYGVK
jgi:hypothetical protein